MKYNYYFYVKWQTPTCVRFPDIETYFFLRNSSVYFHYQVEFPDVRSYTTKTIGKCAHQRIVMVLTNE